MEKNIIGLPNPHKKDGPVVAGDKHMRDGEEPGEAFVGQGFELQGGFNIPDDPAVMAEHIRVEQAAAIQVLQQPA